MATITITVPAVTTDSIHATDYNVLRVAGLAYGSDPTIAKILAIFRDVWADQGFLTVDQVEAAQNSIADRTERQNLIADGTVPGVPPLKAHADRTIAANRAKAKVADSPKPEPRSPYVKIDPESFVPEGTYAYEDKVYRVITGKTGRRYAMLETGGGRTVYAKGMIMKLTLAMMV